MRIAIIGTGISGLGAAYLLHQQHDITVYEKNDYIGGHTRTVEALDIPVDTGFIVFNHRNYPLLTGLFAHLDVPTEKSDMSFGASIDNGWLEYGTQSLTNIFSQKRNLLRPAFWKMIRDILQFYNKSLIYMDKNESITLGQCLDELGMGEWFRHYYLLAMGGAIWSCSLEQMMNFPAKTFIRFFYNHGLLTISDQPQWYTVSGGSREYVTRLTAGFKENIKLGHGVEHVTRHNDSIIIQDSTNASATYDQVVFACHADQALAMLEQPSNQENSIIGAFSYQKNRIILHGDTSFMPKNKKCWASWVYLSESREDQKPSICLSYWMNNLQNIDNDTPLIVTLNPTRRPQETLIYDEYVFEHPVFDQAAIEAQTRLDSLQGQQNTWYCGAYHRYGFHEDGLWSAVNIAQKMGVGVPWT